MENQVKKRNVFKALKGLSKKMKVIIGIAIIVVICLFIVLGVNRKSDVDTTFLTQILTKSSELTTAKLKITGLSEYHDEGIYIFNRSDFTMCYTTIIRAGINLENVKIDSDPVQKKIYITIPKAEIFEAKVDPNDIKFYGTGLRYLMLMRKKI